MNGNKNTNRYPGFPAWGIFILFGLFVLPVHANKVLVKTWKADAFQKLEVLAAHAYTIELSAQASSEIRVEAHMEGEHSEQLILNAKIDGKTLQIQPSYQAFFHPPNDKLAAHKVISIALHIQVPENFQVFISAPKAHLEAMGHFQELGVHLENGRCLLKEFQGDADLYTRGGPIEVYAAANTIGEGHTQSGKLVNTLPTKGFYKVKAESVEGDIYLRKTPE